MDSAGNDNDESPWMVSQSRYDSAMNANSLLVSAWHEHFGGPMVTQNHHLGSNITQCPSDSSFFRSGPQFTGFGSGNFSELMGSFYPDVGNGIRTEVQPQVDQQSQRSRKRPSDLDSSFSVKQSLETEPPKNSGIESSGIVKEETEKKARMEQYSEPKSRGKQLANQSKENYIHVRARRGQATNSHSLAERVRREKISERMGLLQELVPGCNKITGKAVMLDEIINYVQSLQQQVEFLSMKLATVNPIGIESALTKDVLHTGGTNAATLGLVSSSSALSYSHGSFQPCMRLPNMNTQFLPMSHTGLIDNFQSLPQTGFSSDPAIDDLGPNGNCRSNRSI